MTTSFPGTLDSFTNPTSTDLLNSATVPHAAQHDNANDAILAIETALGANLAKVGVLANANTFTAANTFAPTATGVVPLTTNIPSGSSSNLLVLQNNGTSQFTVGNFGTTSTNGSLTALGGGIFRSGAIGQIPLVARGFSSSQTADLQQWQSSGTTVVAKIDASGNLTAPNHTIDPMVSGLLFGSM